MILASSERGTENVTKNSQMGENAVATKERELDFSRNLDLTEFVYPNNREVVNFENASVNIDNSNDVIIGPVTQFNVNGNVTIVQNGVGEDVDEENREKKTDSAYGTRKIIESGQALKYWIILIYKRIFCGGQKIFVIITSGILVMIIALVLYMVLERELIQEVHIDEQMEYGHNLGNHSIFYKKDWLGLQCTQTLKMPHPVGLVIMSHTNSNPCFSLSACSYILRWLQKIQMQKGLWDISYNFAIGGDGNIYVGRGWDYINSHPHLSLGISFIGNFNIDKINENMIDAAKKLLEQGVSLQMISEDYVLVGLNQSCNNFQSSPGENVYKEIMKWEHYSNITIYIHSVLNNPLLKYDKQSYCNEEFWNI